MNTGTELPYELHIHGSGAVGIFNVAEQIALPLLTLARATLRAAGDAEELILEFQGASVVIGGHGLASMLDHLLLVLVIKISRSNHNTCQITSIRVEEAPLS